MGKRSAGGFKRHPHDFYRTPWEAVRPLLPHLRTATSFIEPCAGDGALVDHLESVGHRCVLKIDTEPGRADIKRASCFSIRWKEPGSGVFIMNPPWTRALMHPIIEHLCRQAPTWSMHTVQSTALTDSLRAVVSVGRVKWIAGSDSAGKDNAAWYLFDGRSARRGPIEFHPRRV